MTTTKEIQKQAEGWHRPPRAAKFHYFVDGGGMSFCRSWGFAFGADLQEHTLGLPAPGRLDCKKCWRLAEERKVGKK